jgi:hypothetical protein
MIKKGLRYIQGIKGNILTYEISDSLKTVCYLDSDYMECLILRNTRHRLCIHTHK